jgi:hypothetical protein
MLINYQFQSQGLENMQIGSALVEPSNLGHRFVRYFIYLGTHMLYTDYVTVLFKKPQIPYLLWKDENYPYPPNNSEVFYLLLQHVRIIVKIINESNK